MNTELPQPIPAPVTAPTRVYRLPIDPTSLPAASGSYVVLLAVEEPRTVAIGRLGEHCLAPGIHGYVGSARGPGGLRARLRHHLAVAPRPHWHIDYLRAVAVPRVLWLCVADTPLECAWAAALVATGATRPVARFGAGDCRCPGHLVSWPATR